MPPQSSQLLLSHIGGDRANALRTRGMLALKLPRPPRQLESGINWFGHPPDLTRKDLRWYTDGSMKFGKIWELRRTGCAIVVVSTANDLVAFGNAVPAPWVRTAAAAELWAVMLVLSMTPEPPPIVTDCLSILSAAAAGSRVATGPDRPLAQLWVIIETFLDADVSVLSMQGRLTWMPAHGSAATIGKVFRSDGNVVTPTDWRANRLADALAKAAMGEHPQTVAAESLFATAEQLVYHECAVLGATTHAANNHVLQVVGEDGLTSSRITRDSAGVRRASAKPPTSKSVSTRLDPKLVGPDIRELNAVANLRRLLTDPAPRHARVEQRAKIRRAATVTRKDAEHARIMALCDANMIRVRPSSEPPASNRFAALKARILQKETAAGQGTR